MKQSSRFLDDFIEPIYAVKVIDGHHVLCRGWLLQVLSPYSCTVEWDHGGLRHRTREYFRNVWHTPRSAIQHYLKDLKTKLMLQAEDFDDVIQEEL